MMRALYTAASGMQAQQRNIDTTANNLANVNTTGFKKRRSSFRIYCITMNAAPGFHLQFPPKFR
jgi:flagellar basal-body rod protein FlgG